ncbi:MAG TPA: Rpn family recombination-promoting nuclease/putative transposase, partial [Thermotogota bacterium]|nr:Rpn family recombination-promoting nuclease/putative transposase [Thermotogota bacterium]
MHFPFLETPPLRYNTDESFFSGGISVEKINKSHDRFFKEVLGDIETAKSFLQHYLPPK